MVGGMFVHSDTTSYRTTQWYAVGMSMYIFLLESVIASVGVSCRHVLPMSAHCTVENLLLNVFFRSSVVCLERFIVVWNGNIFFFECARVLSR